MRYSLILNMQYFMQPAPTNKALDQSNYTNDEDYPVDPSPSEQWS